MPHQLYQMLQGMNMNNNMGMGMQQQSQPNQINNILSQVSALQNNPAAILDILLQHGKINQQQYNELQPYKDNPQQIVSYLISHGNAPQIDQARQQAGQYYNTHNF